MKIQLKKTVLIYSILCCSFLVKSQTTQEYFPDSSKIIQQKLEEWQDLKFGLLMHWGPYSQWGIVESWSICPEDLSWATGGRKLGKGEHYNEYVKEYEKLQTTFNPTQFDPTLWAKAAENAGMKYIVFTTKHHDGFCMFDTKYSDYKITNEKTPFHTNAKKNITKEIFDAFRKQGFWTGAYFSKPDWHSQFYWWDKFPPADRHCNYSIKKYPEQWNQFIKYTHNQIDELVSDYGKLDILWLDGGWVRKTDSLETINYLTEEYEGSRYARNPQSQDINMPLLVKNVRAKQPELIVVDRAVKGPYQNYLTPEQHIPDKGLPYPWETCMTMANSWSYVPNDKYKSSDELIQKLVDVVSKGGNFLLNIGPSPDGKFDDTSYARLNDIGNWMKINSQAIYKTRMFDVYGEDNGIRYTRSKDKKTVYVFIPSSLYGKVALDHLVYKSGMKLSWLESSKKVMSKVVNGKVNLELPTVYINAFMNVMKVEME